MTSYKVILNNDERIVSEAKSARQAKLMAGFSLGLGGNDLTKFMRNPKVRVKRM